MNWLEWINDFYTPTGTWSDYIRAQGPVAMLFMTLLLLGFLGLFLGSLQFYRPDQDEVR